MKVRIPLAYCGDLCAVWKWKLVSIVLLLFIILPNESAATHIMGSDLTYECLGPNQYLVRLKLFRDCNGINPNNSYPVRYTSASCGVNSSFSVNLVGSPTDITPLCPSQLSRCQGGSIAYGVEEWIYEGVLNLPPGCGNDWVVSWQRCCRNNAITTLNNPGNNTFYVSTIIDNTLTGCNNSPEFLNFPTPFACINQLVNYNHGVFDQDGDSLVFSLGPCMQDPLTLVDYLGGYNATNPLSTVSGTTIDQNTGDIVLTPNAQQVGVICVLVEEYRNGVKIGEVVRDMQFTVFNCTNNLPVATGIDSSGVFDLDVCEGEQFCFDIFTGDVDPGDMVSISWNNGIPAGVFTVNPTNPPSATFCWTPTALDVGSHFFTVTVEDDHCPFIGANSYAYTVNVNPNTNVAPDAGIDVEICRGDSVTLNGISLATNILGWRWTDGVQVRWGQTQIVRPITTTLYTLTTYHSDGCNTSDDILVTVKPRPSLSVFPIGVSLCPGGSAQLGAISSPTATINWTPALGLSCANCPNPIASPTTTTQYTVTALDTNGCGSRSRNVTVSLDGPFSSVNCDVIYVAPGANGAGTKGDPADFRAATMLAQCNNTTIKMATGFYMLDSAITTITSYTNIEGGFVLPAWEKTSAAGATTIFRTANNPEDSASAPRLVAIYLNSATDVRFQDVTIMTDNAVPTGHYGMSTYGVHMTNCKNYQFTRCQIIAGNAGDGADGLDGIDGLQGSNGADGLAGFSSADPGNGGSGGTGAGFSGGTPGAGGVDPPGCCSAGIDGWDGSSAGTYRDGAGGGGGGSGAETDMNGGNGGSGGSISGPIVPMCGGIGGTVAIQDGTNGLPGNSGTIGAFGLPGPIGYDSLGLWVPGSKGSTGTDGEGGAGGCGGGGGFATTGEIGKGGGGGGGGGQGGTGGTGGYGGGASYGVMIYNNGTNGNFVDCYVQSGSPGNGGNGGNGGAGGAGGSGGAGESSGSGAKGGDGGAGGAGGNGGDGGPGTPGISQPMQFIKGTPPATTDIAFNLAAQPVINASGESCTDNPINFTSAGAGVWNFGADATPSVGAGSNVATQYDSIGRKTILYQAPLSIGVDQYTDFVTIAIDGNSYTPTILTTANPYKKDSFLLCQGSTADFVAGIASADSVHWDFGGATVPNIYHGDNFFNLTGLAFNTPGVYHVVLNVYTSCCGWSAYDTINLIVEMQPSVNVAGLTDICVGDSTLLTAVGADDYVWSPISGLDTSAGPSVYASPLVTRAYTVTGFSPRNTCTDSRNLVVTVHQYPNLVFATTDADCDSNGTATVTPTTIGPFDYIWDDPTGQTSQTITGLIPGNYNVTVTHALAGCISTGQATVNYGSGPIAFIDSSTFTRCYGTSDGFASVAVIGGTPPYTYQWSTLDVTPQVSNLMAGTYMVLVNDSNNCSARTAVTIFEPPLLIAHVIDSIDATCPNSSNGEAFGNAYGGTGSFNYLWNDPGAQDSAHAVNLAPGVYTLSVTDQNGCTGDTTVTIGSPGPLVLDTVRTDLLCYGDSNAYIAMDVQGGTPPYAYSWSDGQTNDTALGLVAGSYSVTVTDSLGCSDSIVNVQISQPAVLIADTVSITHVSCNGAGDGAIDISASGGVMPYGYNWSHGPVTEDVSALSGGNFTVIVSDFNNCTDTMAFIVIEPTQLTLSLSSSDVSCSGFADGYAVVTPAGGVGSYSYTWSNAQTTDTITGLSGGTFTVTVTDSNGCSATDSVTIFEPAPLGIDLDSTDALCFGSMDGSATANTTGGLSPYQYSWSNGDTSVTADSLTAGMYSVIVTDSNGCTISSSITINQPAPIATVTNQSTVSCFGGNNGNASVAVMGGNGGYTYLWSNGQTTDTATGLAAGWYYVSVTDTNGCMALDSVEVLQESLLTVALDSTDVLCNAGSSGIASSTVTGGTVPYAYQWSNGDTSAMADSLTTGMAVVTVTDANGCQVVDSIAINEPLPLMLTMNGEDVSCSGGSDGSATVAVAGGVLSYSYLWSNSATTDTIQNLMTGTFTVTVTDGNSCTAIDSFSVNEPATLMLTLDSTDVSCNGGIDGTASVIAAGGTAPYTYLWSNGDSTITADSLSAGNHSVQVTDGNGCSLNGSVTVLEPSVIGTIMNQSPASCNAASDGQAVVSASGGVGSFAYLWSNGQTNDTASNLVSGWYRVTVTDANGCQSVDSVNVLSPAALSSAMDSTAVSCFGGADGTATVSVSGGTPSYAYTWSNGDTGSTADSLAAGVVYVTAIDGNGCSLLDSVVVNTPTAVLLDTGSVADAVCNGTATGAIDLVVTGGTPLYSYAWSNGSATEDLNGIGAGTYSVTVTDAQGCTDSLAGILIAQPLAIVTDTAAVSDLSCYGSADGSIDLTVTGGTPSYTYNWSNGAITQDIGALPSGAFSVTVTDAVGCADTLSGIQVTQPLALTAVVDSIVNPSCADSADGQIFIGTAGGTTPYAYAWSNGASTEDVSNLAEGLYALTVTDANGCTVSESAINVTEPLAIDLSTSMVKHVDCNGGLGWINLNVNGGTPVYQYTWSTSDTTEDINGLNDGSYDVTVTDLNGCTASNSYTVQPANSVVLTLDSLQSVNCYGGSEAIAIARAMGGNPPYYYEWSNNVQDSINANLSSGLYTATVTDSGGCLAVDTIFLGQPTELIATDSTVNVLCYGYSSGFAQVIASGGMPAYAYNWSSGQQTSSADALAAGTYTVTVTDQHGCRISHSIAITQPLELEVRIDSTNVTCFGMENGQAMVYATGGTPAYSFDWSDGNNIDSSASLAPGTYTVSVTDANGCQANKLFSIEQPEPIQVNLAGVGVSCYGDSDGRATAYASGGVPSYSYQWSTGETVNSIAGYPAGSYQVTVTDVNGCTVTRSVVIDSPFEVEADIISNDPSCYQRSDGYAIAGAVGGTPPFIYEWSDGQTEPLASGLVSGVYGVTVTDANQCSVEAHTILADPAPIMLSFEQQSYDIGLGESVELSVDHNIPGDSVGYHWSPSAGLSCTDCPNPSATPYSSTQYTVVVSNLSNNGNQCDAQGILEIFVDEKVKVFIPNAFTPNQDGENDLFSVYGEHLSDLNVQIFNRLGEKLHESSGTNAGWDGTYQGQLQNPGVYVYQIEASFINGKSELMKGSVTLIR